MLTEAQKDKILESREAGVSFTKIAEMLNVPRSTVYNFVKQQEDDEDEVDWEDYEPQDYQFGEEEKRGLSGAELIELEKTKLEGIKEINAQKFKLRETSREAQHKRDLELIRAKEAEKALQAQKEKEQRQKEEKEQKINELHDEILGISSAYLDLDGEEDVEVKRLIRGLKKTQKTMDTLKAVAKNFGLTDKQTTQLTHYKALEAIIEDFEETIEGEKPTDTTDFIVEDEKREIIEELEDSAPLLTLLRKAKRAK